MWNKGDWDDEEREAQDERPGSSSKCTGSSRSHYSVDPGSCPWRQNVEMVNTSYGSVQVTLCGDSSYPPLVTYHDIGLNHSTCFQGMLLCAETSSLLLQNFCILHIDAPGHQAEAEEIDPDEAIMKAEELADQVAEVVHHFGLTDVTCLGATAGAYVLSLFATRHPALVKGLVLVSPLCRAPSWAEWAHNKVLMGLLSFYGMSRFVKDSLLDRFFTHEQYGYHGPGSDSLLSFRRELDEREPENVLRYLWAMQHRKDLTPLLKKINAEVLVVVGALSPFLEESQHLLKHLDPTRTNSVEIDACGSLVTEERPHTMQPALRAFLTRLLPSLPSSVCNRTLHTDLFLYTSSDPSPSSTQSSSQSASPYSNPPQSPFAGLFSEPRGSSFGRSGSPTIAYQELSLTKFQNKLKPIRTRVGHFDEY